MPYMHKRNIATITTGNNVSAAIPVLGFSWASLELPAFGTTLATATANVYCQVSHSAAGPFYRLRTPGVYSGVTGIYEWEVPSSTGSCIVQTPVNGYAYLKVEISTTPTGAQGSYSAFVHVHNQVF